MSFLQRLWASYCPMISGIKLLAFTPRYISLLTFNMCYFSGFDELFRPWFHWNWDFASKCKKEVSGFAQCVWDHDLLLGKKNYNHSPSLSSLADNVYDHLWERRFRWLLIWCCTSWHSPFLPQEALALSPWWFGHALALSLHLRFKIFMRKRHSEKR